MADCGRVVKAVQTSPDDAPPLGAEVVRQFVRENGFAGGADAIDADAQGMGKLGGSGKVLRERTKEDGPSG